MHPVAKKAPPKPTANVAVREVVYEIVKVEICSAAGIGPITEAQAKELLGWHTVDTYAKYLRTRDVQLTDDEATALAEAEFAEFLLKDEDGKKVKCFNNTTNRPFADTWARQIAQDILNLQWKFNLETIIISKTGIVTSGQHRLIALILACQLWRNKPVWNDKWDDTPTIESLVAFGGSEDPSVLQTVDNVKPRSLSDVIYTSPTFADLKTVERKECSKMHEAAINLAWKRTQANHNQQVDNVYQTHSESLAFADNHKSIEKAVKHLFEENRERAISGLRLSAGECSAICYLQAASGTDGDHYRNTNPRTEKRADLSNWDKACEFWVSLAAKDSFGKAVGAAIADLIDIANPIIGRRAEKHATLAKAWKRFLTGKRTTKDDLKLEYGHDAKGVAVIIDCPDFGGIDLGNTELETAEPTPTPEEVAAEAERIKEENLQAMQDKVDEKADSLAATLKKLQEENPGQLLLFKSKAGGYSAWGDDAKTIIRKLGLKSVKHSDGVARAGFDAKDFQAYADKLCAEGIPFSIVETRIVGADKESKEFVEKYVPSQSAAIVAEPAKKAPPKPKPKAK